jgi:hypothetical protein
VTEQRWMVVAILVVSGSLAVLLLRGARDGLDGGGMYASKEGVFAGDDSGAEAPGGRLKPAGPNKGTIRVVRRPGVRDDVTASDDLGDPYRIPGGPGDLGFGRRRFNSRAARAGANVEGQPEQPLDPSVHAGFGRGIKPDQTAPDAVDPGRVLDSDRKNAPSEDPDLILSVPLNGRVEVQGDGQVLAEENLKIDEANGTVEFTSDSMLSIANAGHIQPQAGTISMEVVPTWEGSDGGSGSFIQLKTPEMWQGAISLVRSGPYMLFQFWDADGVNHIVSTDITDWQPGEPHTVTASWGQAAMSIYIDGQLSGQTPYSGDPSFSSDWPLFIGSNPQGDIAGPNAILKDLRIYKRALTNQEIAAAVNGP